jgi:hypothetical protein
MTLYRGLREAEVPGWLTRIDKDNDGTVLITLDQAKTLRPKLSDVELNLWRDYCNGFLAKNLNAKIAMAAADECLDQADIDDSDEVINKYEDD